MKKLRILWGILKRTRADHILLGFVLFLLADAAVIRLVEPDIHRYGVLLRRHLYRRIWRHCYRHTDWKDLFRPAHDLHYFCRCDRHRCCRKLLHTTGRNAAKRNACYVHG